MFYIFITEICNPRTLQFVKDGKNMNCDTHHDFDSIQPGQEGGETEILPPNRDGINSGDISLHSRYEYPMKRFSILHRCFIVLDVLVAIILWLTGKIF